MEGIKNFFKKILITNRCDTCGWTTNRIFVTEILMEGGLVQCETCIKEEREEYRKKNNLTPPEGTDKK